MDVPNTTIEKRNRLVHAYWESRRQTTWPIFQSLSSSKRKREYAKQARLLDQYAALLPAVPLSRCPDCGRALHYVFDPMGLDGPWWHVRKLADFAQPNDDHFRVLLGGVAFHGREPVEAKVHRTVRPGPEVPFVVPRLLELAGVRAVVSSLTLPSEDTAYLVAYFSPNPVHGALLHQPWARIDYEVLDESGKDQGWSVSSDRWDFDLEPWVAKGKLAWIAAGDETLTLRTEGPCPYAGLPGVRAPQQIDRGKLSTIDLPKDERPQPFE